MLHMNVPAPLHRIYFWLSPTAPVLRTVVDYMPYLHKLAGTCTEYELRAQNFIFDGKMRHIGGMRYCYLIDI